MFLLFGLFWLVVIDLLGAGKARRQISMRKGLMAEVDDYCRYTGVTFSDFLSMAAALYLQVDPTKLDDDPSAMEDAAALEESEFNVASWQADRM